MTEILFYHLELFSLEQALPKILGLCLERKWRVVVEVGSPERLEALDAWLWTFNEEVFLPHGTARDGFADRQPVYLTLGSENPNGATVRVQVDRAPLPADPQAYDRVVLMFDGRDGEALQDARAHWKTLKDAGHKLKYYQQTQSGGWEMKAEAN